MKDTKFRLRANLRWKTCASPGSIDYVYIITSALKSINHADNSKDPGSDGDDVFGETIAYYDNDYSGAGYNAGTLPFSSYTNQYGGAIKGIGWRSPADNQMNKNAYAFTYDPLYQLTNSDFGTLSDTLTYIFSVASNVHKETIGGYDKNGNITSLQRRNKDGTLTGDYSYVYHTASNKLDKINHSSSLLVDYTYNAIGQMTQQIEGGETMNVAYNAYGLVKSIRNGSNQLMQEYFYDDQGNRFMSKMYYNGALGRTLYYIHDAGGNVLAIYEKVGSTTTLIEVPVYASGRIATYKPQVNTYFYEVNDHLGNVRAVIGAPATDTYRATMESENATLEEAPSGNFKNIAARRVTFVGANVTANYTNSLGTPVTGNEVIRVNNTASAGPGTSLAVSPGDKLSAEVWAYYESGSSYQTMTAIAGAFGGVSGAPGEAGQIYNDINSGVSTYIGDESGTTQPAAYLQYIVFDANRNPTGQKGFFRVTTASNMAKAKVPMPEITIEQPGFIYIFVYNRSDSPNWVYFDELLVTHEHSTVVAGADYYPFGLPMDGREITDEPYRWGYQGQYAQENDSTGWSEFQLRMYDARFGRWLSPDPYGQYASPYVAMGNMPHMGTDPDGGLFGVEIAGQFILENLPLIQSFASGATLLSMTAVVVETTIWNGVQDGLARFGYRMMSGLKNTGNDLKIGFLGATDVVAGFNRSVAGDLAPEYHNRSEASLERQEIGETIGTAFQAALALQGIGKTGIPGTQLQPVRTTPGVTVTTQVSTPAIRVTDVHGRINIDKGDFRKAGDDELAKAGFDAHEIKRAFLGSSANVSHFDLYVNKLTREIWIFRKGMQGDGIQTGIFIQ